MKVIIVGCGRVGSELANELSQTGHDVTIVDKNPQSFERLGPAFKGQMVEGVGFDRDVLVQAGVERADALAAVTSGDNSNVITARVARRVFRVPKVVARLYDPRRVEIYQRLGLQTFSTTTWGVRRVIQLLAYRELNVVMALEEGDVELVAFEVPPHWVSRTVGEVTQLGEISVVAISRHGKGLIPMQGSAFQDGDRVTLAILATSRNRLESLLAWR
jgi:trk system potassium uptake protein TrkA